MSDDVDIYDDLPDLNLGESVTKVEEERQDFKKQLDEKVADLHKTQEKIAHLEKENKILEKNISSLYQTAVNEIKRKDQLIEELRREKESLIFRRKGRQNNIKSADASSSGLNSNFHQVSSLPAKHLLTSMESTKTTLSMPVNNLKKNFSTTSCSAESLSDTSCNYKRPIECLSSSFLERENRNSCCKVSGDSVNVFQTNTKISEINRENLCENNFSEINVNFISESQTLSEVPHRSGSKEHSQGTILSKNAKQSLSLEERREKQKDNYSDKYSKIRDKSSHNSYRSLKLPSERNRNDRSCDHNKDRKYSRDSCKKTEFHEQKSRTGTCVETRRRPVLHSRRSPSPPQRSRRYSDMRHSNSKVKTLSDNVRIAAQLKSKYSKAMRERSVSRTPIKQQKSFQKETNFESNCKPVELQNTIFPKINLEDRFVNGGHKYECKLNCREHSNEKSLDIDQIDSVQRKESNSKVLEKSCQSYKYENAENEVKRKEEISLEFNLKAGVTEHNSSAQSDGCSGKVNRCKSFHTESEVVIINKENASEKLPLQQLRTPPSKNLIPLKISPSFEDPAIVREKKFSFCVFNEQCEFKRSKRKRSVKLLVSDIKKSVSENCEKDNSTSYDNNCASSVTVKQNMNLCQHDNNCEQSACNVKNGTADFKRQLNNCKGMIHNNCPLQENLQEISESNHSNSIQSPDIETLRTQIVSEVDVPKNKSPNKKKKLDFICEELKANLEKRHVTSQIQFVADGNTLNIEKQSVCNTTANVDERPDTVKISNFNMTVNDAVNSIDPPKRIIVPKRRRKVYNLQDNVVQVISQVKSRLT